MSLTLTLRNSTTLPIEVEGITPDTIAGKSLSEVERLDIYHGKEKLPLAEFFGVEGAADDQELRFQGDCQGVHWIGAKSTQGTIFVEGNAGRHLGSQMCGGEIIVKGNCGDWLGGEMRSGRITVHGSAGHQVGAAYRGSARGMRGGEILIRGDAGNEIGARMRRGLIAIGGKSGDAPGYAMLEGTILLFGDGGIRPGANMKRGTIAYFSSNSPELLSTFRRSARLAPSFMNLLLRNLQKRGFPIIANKLTAPFEHYAGDFLEGGRGEILVAAN